MSCLPADCIVRRATTDRGRPAAGHGFPADEGRRLA